MSTGWGGGVGWGGVGWGGGGTVSTPYRYSTSSQEPPPIACIIPAAARRGERRTRVWAHERRDAAPPSTVAVLTRLSTRRTISHVAARPPARRSRRAVLASSQLPRVCVLRIDLIEGSRRALEHMLHAVALWHGIKVRLAKCPRLLRWVGALLMHKAQRLAL